MHVRNIIHFFFFLFKLLVLLIMYRMIEKIIDTYYGNH